jgi:hypothetical protein
MKTDQEHKEVRLEDLEKAWGRELMENLAAALHTAVHEDALVPRNPVDKPEKPRT